MVPPITDKLKSEFRTVGRKVVSVSDDNTIKASFEGIL